MINLIILIIVLILIFILLIIFLLSLNNNQKNKETFINTSKTTSADAKSSLYQSTLSSINTLPQETSLLSG